ATGHFELRVSRRDGVAPEYRDRVEDAVRFGAEAFLSLHSDVRSQPDHWSPAPGVVCPVSYAAPGFSVLYADEGGDLAVERRRRLARETAFRLVETGLYPYGGEEYAPLYEADLL